MTDEFMFTITDLARFLGKAAVTLRGWERQGLVVLPRDSGGDRKLTSDDIRSVAQMAYDLDRINLQRLQLVEASVTLLNLIEAENA